MKESSLSEITLRKYERPYQLNKRELAKKVCLSFGLLQEGDSRDIVVDILLALLEAKNKKQDIDLKEIKTKVIEIRKKANLELKGIADSNIRRQLKRLRDFFIVEKINNNYRITEFLTIKEIFSEKMEKFYIKSIIERIKEYLEQLDSQ